MGKAGGKRGMNITPVESYLSAFTQMEGKFIAPWFSERRRAALDNFQQNGFPTSRQENWKYTDVRPIAKCEFNLAKKEKNGMSSDQIDRIRWGLDCQELIFINGHFSSSNSRINNLLDGVILESLVTAADSRTDIVQNHLGNYADYSIGSFTALNTAFLHDGALVYIPENTVIDKPICIFYLSAATKQPFITHPRNLIILGANAQATVIESYIGTENTDYFTNTVTEVIIHAGAKLEHYKIQQENGRSFHIGSFIAHQEKNSRLESHSISLGGRLVRNDLISNLTQAGAEVTLNGLYMARNRQHVDNHTLINHLEPYTRSEEYYRGVLDDHARGVFNGKVIVHKDAQKTDAHQSNANLLLSDNAEADTKPELEIYADDVKCSHGATVGQLDKQMLFYLRSRAIEEEKARSLLTYAFAEDVIKRIKFAPIRKQLEDLVIGRLPDAALIREFVT